MMSSRSTARRDKKRKGEAKGLPKGAVLTSFGELQQEINDRIDIEARLTNKIAQLEEELEGLRWHDAPQPKVMLDPGQVHFPTGAVRRKILECRLDLIPLEALEALGDRLHYGATVRGYGERNWEKGIPYSNLIQHAMTHAVRFAAQAIANPHFLASSPITSGRMQSMNTPEGEEIDSLYGNACAALWNWMAIVTFLHRGNPAEKKP